MFDQDINAEVIYPNDWSEFPDSEGNSPVLSRLFDNLFSWIDPVDGAGFFKNQNQLSAALIKDDPSLDITALEDGFELEARKLDAIRQRSSRGFTIIDINPGLLSEQDAPLNLPYEFLFDGTNYIPDQSDSIIKNFRTISLDVAGNFVKVEYIYENNSNANSGPYARRPYANIKYQQALKNGSELDLSTGYLNYYFDNFARNKVYLGFGDSTQKPHLITKSGTYFKTYFNTLALSFNVGAPKMRITIGFNSEKYDGNGDTAMNSRLHLMGAGRLFSEIDTPLMPMNVGLSDTFKPTPSNGVSFNMTLGTSTFDATLIRAFADLNAPVNISYGYSVLFITDLLFYYQVNSAAVSYRFCIELLVSNANGQETRLAKIPYFLDPTTGTPIANTIQHRFGEPLRVVIPYNNQLVVRIISSAGAATTANIDVILQGYSLGNIRKIDQGINFDLLSSKFVTDSTFLTDFNRVQTMRDS